MRKQEYNHRWQSTQVLLSRQVLSRNAQKTISEVMYIKEQSMAGKIGNNRFGFYFVESETIVSGEHLSPCVVIRPSKLNFVLVRIISQLHYLQQTLFCCLNRRIQLQVALEPPFFANFNCIYDAYKTR